MNELNSVASASRTTTTTTGSNSSNNNGGTSYSTSAATSTTGASTRRQRTLAALRSPRRVWYCALFISSLIAMGSTFEAVKMQRRYVAPTIPPTPTQQWSVASITITFLLTFLILSFQITSPAKSTTYLHGTKLELFLILLLAGLSCSSVGTATNPASGMAVNASGGVSFGNLFYSTWASFISAMGALLSFLRTERGFDVSNELSSRGNRFRTWAILIIASLIVMGSSASCYDAKCDELYNDVRPVKYCRRAAFGVSAGCIGCVASLAVVAMRVSCATLTPEGRANRTIFMIEGVLSVGLFCIFGFAVAYLTSEKGPGAPLGNLYYSSWAAFGLTFFVATSCFEEFQAAKSMILLGRQPPPPPPQPQTDQYSDNEREALNSDANSIGMPYHGTPYTNDISSIAEAEDSQAETGQSTSASSGMSSRVTGSVGEVQI